MAEGDKAEASGGGKGHLVIATALVALAAGAGAAFTAFMASGPSSCPEPRPEAKMAVQAAQSGSGMIIDVTKEHLIAIEPIILNVAGPGKRWLRLEGAVAFQVEPGKDEQGGLMRQISEDVLGYLRATSIAQLETPAGFEFLREDLADLVRLRSKGRARRFILKSLVLE